MLHRRLMGFFPRMRRWRWIRRSWPMRAWLLILSWQLTSRWRLMEGTKSVMEAPVTAVRGRRQCICQMAETKGGLRIIRDAASAAAVQLGA